MLGAKRGFLTPSLSDHILKFHSNPLIRIFRVLGGICILISLGNSSIVKHFSIPLFIKYFCLFIALLFVIYSFCIFFFRIKHIIEVLRSDKLDIKNSPLDK